MPAGSHSHSPSLSSRLRIPGQRPPGLVPLPIRFLSSSTLSTYLTPPPLSLIHSNITMRTSALFIALTLVTATPGFAAPIPYVRFFPAYTRS
jgi:hypothetical protein